MRHNIEEGQPFNEPIEIERHEIVCMFCRNKISIAKIPDTYPSFYEEKCKRLEEQLSAAYAKIRKLEDELRDSKV